MADGENDLAFIRITLIGMTGCGKTSLATSFVNNAMPATPKSTSQAELYYTTVRMGGDGDDSGAFNALCEIEDTFGSDRKDVADRFDNFLDLRWPLPEVSSQKKLAEKTFKDDKGVVRSMAFPFAWYDAPLTEEDMKKPMTKNRMAYMIVFDANVQKSYQEAMKLHQLMQEYWVKKEIRLKPVVLLVGNKIDELGDDFDVVNQSAQVYSEDNSIPYFAVSALQYKGVKNLFRNAIQRVRVNQSLWALEYRQRTSEEDENAGCGIA